MSYLAGLIHKKQTAPEVGEWLAELADSPLAADPHSDTGADIVNLKRDYDRKTKLPQALVEELAKLSVLGQQLWVEARKANDFARFRPLLGADDRAQAAGGGRDWLRRTSRTMRCSTNSSRARRRRKWRGACRAARAAGAAGGRDRGQSAAAESRRAQGPLSGRSAGEVWPAGGRGDRLRLQCAAGSM